MIVFTCAVSVIFLHANHFLLSAVPSLKNFPLNCLPIAVDVRYFFLLCDEPQRSFVLSLSFSVLFASHITMQCVGWRSVRNAAHGKWNGNCIFNRMDSLIYISSVLASEKIRRFFFHIRWLWLGRRVEVIGIRHAC